MTDYWAKEKAARAVLHSQVCAAVQVVAAKLGEGWAASQRSDEEFDARYFLIHSDGRKFSVSANQWSKGKVTVRAWYDYGQVTGLPHGESVPEISVTLARGGEVLAAEIKRRFLSEFDRLFLVVKSRREADDAARSNKDGIIDRLCTLVGSQRSKHMTETIHVPTINEIYGTARVNYGGSIDFDLRSLSEAQFVAVYNVLKETKKHDPSARG